MKPILRSLAVLLLLTVVCTRALAVEFFSGGYVCRDANTKQYAALSPYYSSLSSQVSGSILSATAKANARALISSASFSVPGSGGTISGSGCTLSVSMEPVVDYLVPAGYIEGSAYAVSCTISVQDTPPPQKFTLTVTKTGDAADDPSSTTFGSGTYPAGEQASYGGNADSAIAVSGGNTVTMDGPKTVSVDFRYKTWRLEVSGTGPGHWSTGGSGTFRTNQQGTATCSYDSGTTAFVGWSIGGNEGQKQVGPGSDGQTITVVGTFDKTRDTTTYTLQVSASGPGTVSGGGSFTEGSNARPTATWDPNTAVFDGWSGDASGTSATLNLVMDRNKSVTARFSARVTQPPPNNPPPNNPPPPPPEGSYTLTTTASGPGSVAGGGTYPAGRTVQVFAVWNAGTTRFDGFSGAASGLTNPQSVTMNSNKLVVASFSPIGPTTYTVTVIARGPGSAAGGGTFVAGAATWVKATWDTSTAVFDGFTGSLTSSNPSNLVRVDSNQTIYANFRAVIPPPQKGTGSIAVRTYDHRVRTRTMIGVPYVISYTANGQGVFSVTRSGAVLKDVSAGSSSFSQEPSAVGDETVVLNWAAKAGDPWQEIAQASVTVLPRPVATINDLPSIVTIWPDTPSASAHLTNLYPGAYTWVQLMDEDGKIWRSKPIIGSASGDCVIDVYAALQYIRRTNNTVTVQVYSDDAVSGWQAAAAAGKDDGSGRATLLQPAVTFGINISGVRQLNVNRL